MNITRWIAVSIVLSGTIFGLSSYKTSLQQAAAAQGANMPEPAATVTAVAVGTINYQKTILQYFVTFSCNIFPRMFFNFQIWHAVNRNFSEKV